MQIKKIVLKNFRNFIENEFLFSNSITCIVGENGVGKSNILESIYLLCTGKSQRKAKKREMLNFDKNFFLSREHFNMIMN